jgi:hypothetical protein
MLEHKDVGTFIDLLASKDLRYAEEISREVKRMDE